MSVLLTLEYIRYLSVNAEVTPRVHYNYVQELNIKERNVKNN